MTKLVGQHEAPISRATARLGFDPPEDLVEEARKLTAQKVAVKGLPDWYAPLLLEDEIVDACFRAAINGRLSRCAQYAT